jgi:predicted DNA-binding WGR domain protein
MSQPLDEDAMARYIAESHRKFTRFEFEEDDSSKFWEVTTAGADVTARWGRIGTYGRVLTKSYANESDATEAAEKQIREKQYKGYERVEESELGEEIGEFLERIGMWTHPELVRLGNGREDFDDPWENCGSQSWWVDGEDMAEGDMDSVLEEMAPSLRLLGVDLRVVTVTHPYGADSTGYDLHINEIPVEMYRTDPANPHLPLCDDPWMDCSVKPLTAVNQLLRQAGSVYRMGLLNPGGNDGLAVLLPYDVLVRLRDSGIFSKEEFVLP